MVDYKTIISLMAVILAFVGYVPYIRDVLKGKTVPHMFTWLIWTLAISITCGLQIVGGAGVGVWATVAVAAICLCIFILSLKVGKKDITTLDIFFLILALISLFLWLVAKQPVWSAILVVTTDLLGFAPTIRKSWSKPHSETLSAYEVTSIRHALSIFALQQYNVLTLLYPVAWTVANVAFCVLLVCRRKILNNRDVQETNVRIDNL